MEGRVLADGLEHRPGVSPTHVQRCVVVEDVVAQIVQGGLWVRGGKLSGLLYLFADYHVDFLDGNRADEREFGSSRPVRLSHHFLSALTFNSSTEAMLLLSMRSFNMEMGSLLLRTSWISSRVR